MITLDMKDIALDNRIIDPRMAEPALKAIIENIKKGEKVALSFKGIDMVITAVLQILIGKLYDPKLEIADKIDANLLILDADKYDLEKIEEVKKYARMFYEEPKKLEKLLEDD